MVYPAWLVRGLAFDRAGVHPAVAARTALGVLVPLVVGIAVGHPAEGAQAAAGALPVGIAAMTGVFGPPTGLMVATTAGMALSTFVGSLVAGHPIVMVPTLAVWGFVAGLMVTFGRAATVVGVQAVVGLVVFGRYPGGVDVSAAHAAWVLAGGLVQLTFAQVLRTPRRFARERQAVASAYDVLGALAEGVWTGMSSVPAAEAIAQADALVARRVSDEAAGVDELRGLVDEAARMRLELLSLAAVAETDELRAATRAAADWLRLIADALRSAHAPEEEDEALSTAVDQLRRRRGTTSERFTAARISALLGQLRAAQRLAFALSGVRRLPLPRVGGLRPTLNLGSRAESMMRRLRLAVDPRTPEMRHAVRLAVLLAVASLVADVLPWQRGWWVVLTTVVVLKPDYASTMQRGVARVVGTAAGVLLAGAIVGGLHPHDMVLAVLVGVFAWASYAVFAASFAVYTFLLTAVVVFMVSTFDPRPLAAIADRGLDTVVGGAIALAGYALWPTREAPTLRATIRGLLAALATYADLVLAAYSDPQAADAERLTAAARASRRARADAQASVDRAIAEPARLRPDTQAAVSVLSSARRIVVTLHSLRTAVQDSNEPVSVPELASIRGDVVGALRAASSGNPAPSDLREAQQRLQDAADRAGVETWHGRRLALAAAHLDPLVDSIHTIAHVLSGAGRPSSEETVLSASPAGIHHP